MRVMTGRTAARMVLLGLLALLLLGQSVRSPAVEAEPTGIVVINPLSCFFLTIGLDWNGDTVADGEDDMLALNKCYTLNNESSLRHLVQVLGGDPDNPQTEDFAPIDVDGNQMHEEDGSLFILFFVPDDSPVAFYADEGQFPVSGSASAACGPLPSPDFDFVDEDCDDGGDRGDGVVVAKLVPGPDPNRGPATVRVHQGILEMEEDYTIVGEPYEIQLTAVEPSIEVGAADCQYPWNEAEWDAAVADAHKTGLVARVLDDDGTAVTGALVAWESDDESRAVVAGWYGAPVVLTSDLGAGRIEAVNVLCGGANTGAVTVEAAITDGLEELGISLDPYAGEDNDIVEVQVVAGTPVGGIAEFPALEPEAAPEGSAAASIVMLAGAAAGVALLAAGGWYARRRYGHQRR